MSNIAPTNETGDWPPETFRKNGEYVLERLENWFATLRDQPVRPAMKRPQELLEDFGDAMPEHGDSFDTIVDDTFNHVFSESVLWNHPRHHAYFSNSSSAPAILAEMCTAALNANVMVWDAAPAPAAVEYQVLHWLAQLADIRWTEPDAVLVDGASQATLYALAAAREHCCEHDFRNHGASNGPQLRVYCSAHTHSSVHKAAITLGIGADNVLLVSDEGGLIDASALDAAIRDDRERGFVPLAIVATVGTTATGSIDDVSAISEVATRHNAWLHVDAAYGGLWKSSDAIAHSLPPLDVGDSVVINPHKVLFCPMEASALYCRHKRGLVNTFALVPEYLRTNVDNERLDFMNYTTQLGRQFRALKIWWIIRSFGRSGLSRRLDYAVSIASDLKEKVRSSNVWRIASDTPLPLVCIRPNEDIRSANECDSLCRSVHDIINFQGDSAVSHATVDDRYVIRISIGNIHTTANDVDLLWDQIINATEEATTR